VAESAAVADNGVMRFALALLAPAFVLTACPPSGFTPDDPDAGFADDTIDAADIGVPCVYDPATGGNPTNQCNPGTECVIVTRDGRFNTLGMTLPFWEDQLTVAAGDVDIGYCSVVGSAVAPPQCPVGTILKLVSSGVPGAGGFAALCLKPCSVSAECGSDRVCDARYIDDGTGGTIGFCVSPCVSDLNHCVRSGVLQIDDQGSLGTALFFGDVSGESVCNDQTGICEAANKNPAGIDGAPCASSSDCATDLACYQAQVFSDPPDIGFCAKRCTVESPEGARPEQGSCSPGEACQPGLAFGYNPNAQFAGMLVVDQTGAFGTREGICLDICVEGLDECVDGTVCGAVDGGVTGQTWIGVEMCTPPAIAEGG
jgi:hypothetical protein